MIESKLLACTSLSCSCSKVKASDFSPLRISSLSFPLITLLRLRIFHSVHLLACVAGTGTSWLGFTHTAVHLASLISQRPTQSELQRARGQVHLTLFTPEDQSGQGLAAGCESSVGVPGYLWESWMGEQGGPAWVCAAAQCPADSPTRHVPFCICSCSSYGLGLRYGLQLSAAGGAVIAE